MKLPFVFGLLILLTNSISAQKTGVVIDKLTNRPIPFVNIHISGTKIGFTTNNNGEFLINANQTDTAIFSAIGFERKRLPIKQMTDKIFLSQKIYEIPEVTVQEREKAYCKIGRLKRQFPSHHLGNGFGCSKMVGQLIPYEKNYGQTPFIKSIEFLTHSDVKNAKFNIRLYQLNSKGDPDEIIHNRNIIAVARRGNRKTKVDLDSLNIKFPTNGLVVAIEWLNSEENKFEYRYTMEASKKKLKAISIEPSFSVYKDSKNDIIWSYWGNWHRDSIQSKSIQMEITLEN